MHSAFGVRELEGLEYGKSTACIFAYSSLKLCNMIWQELGYGS
ncbi:MAG: hypothetical protein QW520_02350 [Methanomassiliicoccales archaeon]